MSAGIRITGFMLGQVPALLLAATALLAGCTPGLLSHDNRPVQTYVLEAEAPRPANLLRGGPVLRVADTGSAPGYGSADMIYSKTPHCLDRYARHRWADAPARMFTPLLRNRLESSGLYGAVIGPESRALEDLRLDTEILRLQQAFEGERSEVLFDLRVSLTSARSGRQLASSLLSEREAAAPDPYGGVQAAHRAMERLLQRIEALLRDNTP